MRSLTRTPSPTSLSVEPLAGGVVHVWRASISELGTEVVSAHYAHLLSTEELAKFDAFVAKQARLEFLLGRIMMRTLLSHYFPNVAPRQWKFNFNAYGKPMIENSPVDFSLSHSGGFVVLAFALDAEVGIDIECARENLDIMELAASVFSARELAVVRAEVSSAQKVSQTFYRFWTLKEAYIKARGMGLSLPLEQFTFHLPADNELPQRISIAFESGIKDEPAKWWFTVENYRDHAVAIAVRRDGKVAKLLRREFSLEAFTYSRSG